MDRRLGFEIDPDGFCEEWQDREAEMSERIAKARDIVNDVHHTRRDLLKIATLTSHFKVDGHRGDLVILRGAQAHAAFQGRTHHRRRYRACCRISPCPIASKGRLFEDTSVSAQQLQDSLQQISDSMESGDGVEQINKTTRKRPPAT